jgi:hypothetical protein
MLTKGATQQEVCVGGFYPLFDYNVAGVSRFMPKHQQA